MWIKSRPTPDGFAFSVCSLESDPGPWLHIGVLDGSSEPALYVRHADGHTEHLASFRTEAAARKMYWWLNAIIMREPMEDR